MQFDQSALDEVRKSRLLLKHLDEWLVGLIKPYLGSRIIEIGCGYGNIIRHLSDRELVIGLDIDEPSVSYVNSQSYSAGNVQAYVGDVTEPEFLNFGSKNCDTAISLNVLEHIEDDELSLRQIRQILSPGGQLILVLPAHEYLYGTMDRTIGHYRRYTKDSLSRKLTRSGLSVRLQEYVNPVGAVGWWVNGRVLGRKVPPQSQLRLFNRIMPIVSRLEQMANPGFGLSILSVSEKATNRSSGKLQRDSAK